MALSLIIDGTERISHLVHESLAVSQTNDGLNSTCDFDLVDWDVIGSDIWTVEETHVETDGDRITYYVTFAPTTKVEVSVTDGATVYFAGILSRISTSQRGDKNRIYHCACHDFNQMLEEDVVDTLEQYAVQTDEQIIDDIFAAYVTGIDYATFVAGGAYVFDEIEFDGVTVRQVMDTIAAQSQCIWYVDYSKKLHYATVEANAPAWHLSDNPDNVNSFGYYDDIKREVDATNLVNEVFVIGEATSLWFTDAASIAEYDSHPAIVRDTSLVDIDDIEARGEAALAKFKDPIASYNLKTQKDGLRAGMHVRIVCALYDVDEEFLINKLRITFPVDGAPIYHIGCGGAFSSTSAAAHRLILDQLHTSAAYVAPGQVLASRGWSHNLTFSATDDDTVAWTGGTIWTAAGPTFAINAGNTDDPGAMAGIVYVCLDTDVSIVDLQIVVNAADSVGANRILVAVCAPNGDATKDAIFQVFGGGSADVGVFITADNVAVNTLTFNEIAGNTITAAEMNIATLSSLTANMGTLTAGTIQTAAAGNDRVIINIADGIRGINAADVVQFQLDPSDGTARFGAGAGIMDEDGLRFLGSGVTGDTRRIRFMYNDAGTERTMGRVFSDWGGGAGQCVTWVQAWRMVGYPWPANVAVTLAAIDNIAGTDIRLNVSSSGLIDTPNCTDFQITEDLRVGQGLIVGSLATNPSDDDVRIAGGLIVGSVAVDPPVGYCRIDKGLRVGTTASDANDNNIWVDNDVRIGGGLYVGSVAVNPPANMIYVDGSIRVGVGLYVGSLGSAPTDNDIKCDGTIATSSNVTWNLGGVVGGTVTPDTKVHVQIAGNWYTLQAEAGLV